jgi:hypothetical protein
MRREYPGGGIRAAPAEIGGEIVHQCDHQVDGQDQGQELVLQEEADGDLDLLAQAARAEAVPIRRRTTR